MQRAEMIDDAYDDSLSEVQRLRSKAAECLLYSADTQDPVTRETYQRVGQAYQKLALTLELVDKSRRTHAEEMARTEEHSGAAEVLAAPGASNEHGEDAREVTQDAIPGRVILRLRKKPRLAGVLNGAKGLIRLRKSSGRR